MLLAAFLTGFAPLLINVETNPDKGLDPQQEREKDQPMVRKRGTSNNVVYKIPIIFKGSYPSKNIQGKYLKLYEFTHVPLYITYFYSENIYKSTKLCNVTHAFLGLHSDTKRRKGFGRTLKQVKKEQEIYEKIYSSYTLFPYFFFFPMSPEEKR